jgi:signal transduction histidine kinase
MSLEEQKDVICDYDAMLSNIDTAYKSGLLIRHIVNDVLDVRRLEEGRLELRIENIEMNNFITDFNKLMERKVQEHIHVQFSIENSVEGIISDKSRLMQILLNLVTNSFKFTQEGTINLKIFEKGDYIRFECIDTGIGIPNDKKHKIFKRLIQVEQDKMKKLTYTRSGFGLGLYLCSMLTELIGGTIGFESEENQGSTFWVELPKVLKHPSPEQLV